ncbi:AAA family ATPase [Methylocucumis oryzae]|uniref:AAA family ATPase n=1 Tax=Methylocucumis oryzae TaxID=1632867 RepID=UPI0006960632|nr:AAA family ATPase [Methylocucumis oryzae]
MIDQLAVRNFTVFKEAELRFSPGLNVIIGENGTGKTHLLKLAYMFSNLWRDLIKGSGFITEQKVERYAADKLRNVFKTDKIGSLTSVASDGKSEISALVSGCIPINPLRMSHEPERPSSPMPDAII